MIESNKNPTNTDHEMMHIVYTIHMKVCSFGEMCCHFAEILIAFQWIRCPA